MLLEVRDLHKTFDTHGGRVAALHGVDLDVGRAESVGLAGESGCGKSTLARCVLRLIEPDQGSIQFDGVDLLALKGADLRRMRRRMQIVFQDPRSLNPSFRVKRTLEEPLHLHGIADRHEVQARVEEAIRRVHLSPSCLPRLPRQLSGGQKQRVGIARAIILNPDFLVLDEPTSSLDQTIRARLLALLRHLQQESGMAYLFLSHDLSAVRQLCSRVYVMYMGRVVEHGPTEAIYENPQHPYTRRLIAAIPEPDPTHRGPRPRVRDDEPGIDVSHIGSLQRVGPDHFVATTS